MNSTDAPDRASASPPKPAGEIELDRNALLTIPRQLENEPTASGAAGAQKPTPFSTEACCVTTDDQSEPDGPQMPAAVADAWAAVYIDVAEKMDRDECLRADPAAPRTRIRISPLDVATLAQTSVSP